MKGISQNGKIISLSLCLVLIFSVGTFSISGSFTPLELENFKKTLQMGKIMNQHHLKQTKPRL